MTVQPPAPPAPRDVYGTFCGLIDEASAGRITHWLDGVSRDPTLARVHMLFQSAGGSVGDGIFLYNYLRAAPFDLTLYNSGEVQSIATLAFLGAKHRIVNQHATFMLHRSFTMGGPPLNAEQAAVRGHTLTIDDQRTEAILREHLKLDTGLWNDLNRHELWFTADEAVRCGLAHAVGDFAPPPKTPLVQFNFPVQGVTP